jgi:arylsulfatase A-like enzyme
MCWVSSSRISSASNNPTFLQAAGLDLIPEQHVDGISILPLLKGEQFERGPIFCHCPHYGNQGGTPGSSVRHGDWKLIEFFEEDTLKLYNLKDDGGEKDNLADTNPEKWNELYAMLKEWQRKGEARILEKIPDYVPWQ